MRSVAIAACACLSVTVAASAVQRNKPDFSGRWVLVESNMPASIAPAITVRQVSKLTNVRGEPMAEPAITITIDRHFQTGLESATDQVGTIGGSSHGSTGPPAPVRSTRHSTTWDGDRLVINTATEVTGPNPSFHERHEVWSLDPKGILTIVVAEKTPGTERITTTVTYRRGTPDQSLTGSIAGVVRDTGGGVVPGATIRVVTGSEARTAVSDALGRYRLDLVPPGNYRIEAELAGFRRSTCEVVIVNEGREAPCDLTLRVGSLAHVDYVIPLGGFPAVVREASAIAHLRIVEVVGPALIGPSRGSIATEHRATVLTVVKGGTRDLAAGRMIHFWQDQAGEWKEAGQRTVTAQFEPFRPGEEIVGVFRRHQDQSLHSFMGDHLLFRIVNGKVAASDCCGKPWHGIENGMSVDDLIALLRKLSS